MNTLSIPSDLHDCAQRMFRITGFVTALCSDTDQRPLAFARFYHVRRVAWTCSLICALRSKVGLVDNLEKVNWLAWAHDLNRWPFAHNSEKGLFDQAADIPRYFADRGITISPDTTHDLQGIINKDRSTLSTESLIVLLADIITGFIEDPLWTVTALDLRPSFIPYHIAEYLCVDLKRRDIQQRLLEMNRLFASTFSVEPFETQFDELFKQIMESFVVNHDLAIQLPLGEASFENWRSCVKEDFMRQRIFHYNNDMISKGGLLRSRLIEPLYQKLGDKAVQIFTTIDEPETLETCVRLGVIDGIEREQFKPELDYVSVHEPEHSFSRLGRTELENK
jgi:hypothetical protein